MKIEKINENNDISIALLDVMLPDMSGIEVCKYIRQKFDQVGIIMLTAKAQEEDKLEGFISGADDYIVKPFEIDELLARVEAVIRRCHKKVNIADIEINLESRNVKKGGKEVKLTPKNSDIVNFVTVGAIQGKKKNNDLIINSVKELHEKGIHNFKITVIGKGHLKKLPKELQQYFDIKGRLPFDKMYDEIEKADFLITSYDETKPGHIRYNTTGTSGNFQLVYGFAKPCIIIESFGPINGFDSSNSILYKTDSEFANALQKGIEMSSEKYSELQKNLKAYADKLYENSKENLRKLITTKGGINE